MMRETDADGVERDAVVGHRHGRRDTTNFRRGDRSFPSPNSNRPLKRIAFHETKTARRRGRRVVARGFVILDCRIDNFKIIIKSPKSIVQVATIGINE